MLMERRSYGKFRAPEAALTRQRPAITSRRDCAINERRTATTPMVRKISEMEGIKTRMKEISPKATRYRTIILIAAFRLDRRTKRETQRLPAVKSRTTKINLAV
jgi:hypothetical protein